MLAFNKFSSESNKANFFAQIEQTEGGNAYLRATSSYAGFVPNEVFENSPASVIRVYACVEYLTKHNIKCSTSNLAKHTNQTTRTIRNAVIWLCSQRFIINSDGVYLFKNFNPECSMEFVCEKELVSLHLGYWYPSDFIKRKDISNQEIKAFSFFLSMTNLGKHKKKIDMEFIARRLGLSRGGTSRLINRLLRKKLIYRSRPHHKSSYTYETGVQIMNAYKKDLSTHNEINRSDIKQTTENVTSNVTQNVTSLSIKESNISLIEIGKEQRASGTYDSVQKKSLFFLKEVIEFLLVEIEKMEVTEKQEQDIKSLDHQYTKACQDCDLDKIQELRARMAINEIQDNKNEKIKSRSTETKAILSDYQHLLKNSPNIKISEGNLKKIGESVKNKVDLSKYEDLKTRKIAFCLIFNSFILDLAAQLSKSDMRTAIEICLKRLSRDSYDINYGIISRGAQSKCNSQISSSNQIYSNQKYWVD